MAAQVLGLIAHYFSTDDTGQRVYSSPLNMLMLAVPLYLCCQLVLGAAFSALWAGLPRARRLVTFVGVLSALALLLVVPMDFALQHFRGERMTLSVMRTYGPGGMLNSDVAGPVLSDPWYPAITLGIPFAALVLFAALVISARGRATRAPSWRSAAICLLLSVACYAPTTFAYYHQRDMVMPPEFIIAREVVWPRDRMSPERERADRADLRAFLDPSGHSQWMSDSFPLVRSAPLSTSIAEPPDIVVFVIESLRGRDVGYGLHPPAGPSPTPRLDALAAQSVVFPKYIANGEPSPRGFITINAGVWEHKREFIIANFPNLSMDALPARLRARGYRTMALWGGNPSFDNQLLWARRWYDEIDYELPGNGAFYFHTRPDSLVMSHFIERVKTHDVKSPGQPFFAYVASNGTHTPFQPEDGSALPGESPEQRYLRCLHNVDAQIGRVLDFLFARPRSKNTVIIVVGDHSDKTDERFNEPISRLPADAFVWTAALIHGPERLTGAPRRELFTASHVDLFPTILRWVGDSAPRVVFGRDLFEAMPDSQRISVSVNSRGYRIDKNDFTMLIDRTNVDAPIVFRSFPLAAPTAVPLSQTPFRPDDAKRIVERFAYWTTLIEQNRVWPRK